MLNILVVTSHFGLNCSAASNHIMDRLESLSDTGEIKFFVITESICSLKGKYRYKTIKYNKLNTNKYVKKIKSITRRVFKLKAKYQFENWELRRYYYREILKRLNYEKFDLIYSTGGAATVHLAVNDVIKNKNIPWIAEIQDPLLFEDIENSVYRVNDDDIKNLIESENALKNSNVLICLTKACMQLYKSKLSKDDIYYLYPGNKVQANKFMADNRRMLKKDKIKMIHTGTLDTERSVRKIINTIVNMNLQNKVEIVLAGAIDDEELKFISKFDFVKYVGVLPREKAIEKITECDISLVIQNIGSVSKYTIPSKFYEYAALRVPILFLYYKNIEVKENVDIFNYYCADQSVEEDLVNILNHVITDIEKGALKKAKPIDINNATVEFLDICKKVVIYNKD